MTKFLAIFTCAENSKNHKAWNQLDQETQKERMQNGNKVLEQWKQKYKKQIIFEGAPLSKITKKIDMQGIHDIPSMMGAFVVVEASAHDEAAKIFLDHPHFAFFPGDAVEILEQLDAPRG
jgi:predicted nucleotide-binding protein (sugar kinase/HSP70/actin superfamily)